MSAQPRRFDGRVAIVTGASGGIGRSIAERLVAEGATVAGCDLEAPAWLAEAGHVARSCDVTREQSVDALVAEVAERFGRVDVLVNNAGLSISAPIAETSLAAWNQILAVNLTGVFLFCRAALPHMQAGADGEKAIVSVASVAGRRPEALIGPYCAAKAGVINFTKTAALELAPHGIRVNALAPDITITEGLMAVAPEGLDERVGLTVPMGRPGHV
ncbi:MAG TPA: SDR family oxidoreductase, partial [Conexibacter sp.]